MSDINDRSEEIEDQILSAESEKYDKRLNWKDIFHRIFLLWQAELFKDAFHHITRGWAHWKHAKNFRDEEIYKDFISVCGGNPEAMEKNMREYHDEIMSRLEKRFNSSEKNPL